MTTEEYENIIEKTAVYPHNIGVMYCALGLCGEAGEVAEKIKKIYRDKEGVIGWQEKEAIVKEMGDVLWYITALANELGVSLSHIMDTNYNKLIERRVTNTLHGDGDNREKEVNNAGT